MTEKTAASTPPKPDHIRQEDWDAVDVPELTDAWFAKARRGGRPKATAPKELTTLRLDPDVLAHFRATGPGWQTRINEALRKAAGLQP
ncbi:BrnA antitoxin family protein [Azospirillum canadense]|uniref:BrnA antitoxin family protein n=1 Tax=Azospirillum canadense TaxID=403962 RepID=UPI002227C3DB|nr:BrnA antitoxin family protein [Azospirillum canadense]MCW2239279.1 uncharacterized protein (DUF4415 family) [Azospirillum canadense]